MPDDIFKEGNSEVGTSDDINKYWIKSQKHYRRIQKTNCLSFSLFTNEIQKKDFEGILKEFYEILQLQIYKNITEEILNENDRKFFVRNSNGIVGKITERIIEKK